MAKYTELFIEYVQGGGTLPALFDEIEGFEDLFIQRFCDYEIGYETEELFKVKLDLKASLVIPVYKDRISKINNYLNKINTPSKTITQNYGETKASTTELPIDATTAEPSLINQNDEYTNEQIESDYSINNIITMLKYLHKEDSNILEELLNEFKTCFLGVY